MKIISWNLYHRSGAALDDIVQLIERERPDVLLMQETTARIDGLGALIGGHYARNPLPGRVHGLAVWSREPFAESPEILALQPGVVFKRISQIIRFPEFAVANVHLSHGQLLNRRQLSRIAGALPARAAILGDCNLVGPVLLPGFHEVGPNQGTHAFGGMLPIKLDRCFVRGLRCQAAVALPKGASDHRPIAVELSAS